MFTPAGHGPGLWIVISEVLPAARRYQGLVGQAGTPESHGRNDLIISGVRRTAIETEQAIGALNLA